MNEENRRKRKIEQDEGCSPPNIRKYDDEGEFQPKLIEHSISATGAGFAAYAKSNPFLSAASNSSKMGFGFGSTTLTVIPANHAVDALNVVSPKSPKPNPFSSPSPAHNPFMTIVDSTDDLWQKMAKDKLSDAEAARVSKMPRLTSAQQSALSSVISDSFSVEKPSQEDVVIQQFDSKSDPTEDDGDGDESNSEDSSENHDCSLGHNHEDAVSQSFSTFPLPDNYVVVTGEEEDDCLLNIRGKLYRLSIKSGSNDEDLATSRAKEQGVSTAEWVEIGTGPVKVLQSKKSDSEKSSCRLVIRREDKKGGIGTKLLLNVRMNRYVSISQQGEKMLRIICVNSADPCQQLVKPSTPSLQTYLLRTKSLQEICDLKNILDKFIGEVKQSVSKSE